MKTLKKQNERIIKELKSYLGAEDENIKFNFSTLKDAIKFYEICETKKFNKIKITYNKVRWVVEIQLYLNENGDGIIFEFPINYIRYCICNFNEDSEREYSILCNLDSAVDKLNNLCEKYNIKDKTSITSKDYKEVLNYDKQIKSVTKSDIISGIWDNSYVQQLGIIDHCREVITIYDEWKAIKPQLKHTKGESYDSLVTKTYTGFENEVMDLFIILEKWSDGKKELKDKRLTKFKEKADSSSINKTNNNEKSKISHLTDLLISTIKTLEIKSRSFDSNPRIGQNTFNFAYNYFPNECEKLRGSEFDCFYDDSKIDIFLEKLKELALNK